MTPPPPDWRRQALEASRNRDRVLDGVKAVALAIVVIGHSLAWDVSTGSPANVLDNRPGLVWVTWVVQVLPLFFAAGAVANLASWRRRAATSPFLQRRLLRLATPAVLYTVVWTALLLPLAVLLPETEPVGRFLSQLVWFLGIYAAVVVAVPLTSRWASHPILTLGLWLALITVIDALRWNVTSGIGWLNIVLVWGWLHQLGYQLPALRRRHPFTLLAAAAASFASALLLSIVGPYSTSLVSYGGDPEPSNLAPPTLVVALYGLAQVLVLAALWPWLQRILAHDRVWLAVLAFGSRAVEVYLWHIPGVALVAGIAWLLDVRTEPFGGGWWLTHLAGLLVIGTLAWFVAGFAQRADRRLSRWGDSLPRRTLPVLPFAAVIPLVLLSITTTGFATWWGDGLLGLPSSSLLNLAVLLGAWWALASWTPPCPRTERMT